MNKIMTIAAVLAVSASSAFAGGMAEPAVEGEPMVVEEAAGSGNGALIGGLLLLGLLAAAASGGSSSGTSGPSS